MALPWRGVPQAGRPQPPTITQDPGMSQACLGNRLLALEACNSQAATHTVHRQHNRFQDGRRARPWGEGMGQEQGTLGVLGT